MKMAGMPLTSPASVFKHLRNDYTDIRLYHIDGDTVEVPFVLKTTEDKLQSGKVELKTFNTSKKDGNLFVSFEVPGGQTVNHAEFLFEEDNFDATVKLEGSDDRATWFEIVTGQRIVSIKTDNVDFRFFNHYFPGEWIRIPSRYHQWREAYLRFRDV